MTVFYTFFFNSSLFEYLAYQYQHAETVNEKKQIPVEILLKHKSTLMEDKISQIFSISTDDAFINILQKINSRATECLFLNQNKKGNAKSLAACKRIRQIALEASYPTIIAGDFNLLPDTDSMKGFEDGFMSLTDKYNISTTRPKGNELSSLKRNVVDYILLKGDFKINSFEVINSDISDHLPIILDFDI